MAKKKEMTKREARSLKINRIIFAVVGVMIILSMILTMVLY